MNRPPIFPATSIDVPLAREHASPNGVRLFSIDCCREPVVRFSLVFRAGSSCQSVPFSASSAANLLSEGTARHTAQQIAEILDFHGSHFEASIDRDWVVLTFVALSKHFEKTVEIAREMVLKPAFANDEVAIYREKRKQRLAIERSKANTRARELFAATLFGHHHPYGVFHDEALYDTLTHSAIVDFWREHYVAENCFMVCSGCVGDDQIAALSALAADIPRGGTKYTPSFPTPEGRRFLFGPHDGAVQSAVRMGTMLFPRTHPDFAAMQVLATVLGGYFGSRLVRNLREQRGYTYGVFATMVSLQEAGYLAIATEVAASATADTLTQITREIDRLRREPIPEDELEMVKNIIAGEVMRVLDGPFGIADVTIENVSNGTDNTYNSSWLSEVRAITPARLLDLAQRYLDPGMFTTVVVGHPSLETELHADL